MDQPNHNKYGIDQCSQSDHVESGIRVPLSMPNDIAVSLGML
jgi:hypothetical protein